MDELQLFLAEAVGLVPGWPGCIAEKNRVRRHPCCSMRMVRVKPLGVACLAACGLLYCESGSGASLGARDGRWGRPLFEVGSDGRPVVRLHV